MSRIGRMPITVPNNVTIDLADGTVRVKGPKGELSRSIPREMNISRDDATLRVERSSDEPTQRSLHGLTRSLIANMVTGVTDGFSRRRMSLSGLTETTTSLVPATSFTSLSLPGLAASRATPPLRGVAPLRG